MCIHSIACDSNDLQYIKKQSDDIDVQIQRGEDVFLRTERILLMPTHHELSVHDQVETEDESSETGVHQSHGPSVWEEPHEKSETYEDDERNEKTAAHNGEVDFRLESEQCDGEGENSYDSHRHQNFVHSVMRRHNS